ncbi:hypothetical protein [Legionella quateirensis]|uniref:Uncharacterized protein n=1 Tax=Legionella quateirensis TaxID=45072 RepID=A0A378KQQ7_9GAMM|nr:hypothetical protein [Legionella quateirensis]KTD53004.1 hypothetical protein Lqua_0837 [Legionella quateirensis]STY17224.1 Uncharacterised protein [Legionella quateirensis]
MDKRCILISALLSSMVVYADHCPAPNTLFMKQGNKYITLTPPGWRWAGSWGGKPEFKSDNVRLNYAMWDSKRINPDDANRVHCVYGNPVFDGSKSGGLLQTERIIARSNIENKPNWRQFGETYFRCDGPDVFQCLFG